MLIGRDAACARVDELLLQGRSGRSGALLVRGEAGIGKTALLDYAVERAEGTTIVRALGVESEAELQFSGLLELLRPLLDQLAEIPPPQADALRGALGLGSADAVDRFTIGAATLNLLATAAESRPLLVVVDDAQWLDGATSDALLFAAKRLVADAVVFLFAARADGRAATPPAGHRAARPRADHSRGRCAAARPRRRRQTLADVAQRLCEATGGNPLALLEARRLLTGTQLAGREPLPEPVPAGAALERAFAGRAELLPPDSQRALLVAAVSLAHETEVETVAAALAAMGIRAAALETAEDAGLVVIDEGGSRFATRSFARLSSTVRRRPSGGPRTARSRMRCGSAASPNGVRGISPAPHWGTTRRPQPPSSSPPSRPASARATARPPRRSRARQI